MTPHNFDQPLDCDVIARCPHCHVGIHFLRDAELKDAACHRCRKSFSLIHPESTPQDLIMPQQTGGYVLQNLPRIGIGPFGSVYRAQDWQTQDWVTIKVSRGAIISAEEREKFLTKLRPWMQLKQPNIATIRDVGSVEDRVYIISSYVDGIDLAEYLLGVPERKLSIREVVMLCGHIASLLHFTHKFGLVNGNLKPSNIRLSSNQTPCLIDFSLNDHTNGVQMTGNGRIVGTAAYLAPEQLPGHRREIDAQTDVYALGAILYELLTGEKPFSGEGPELLKQIANGSPVPPRALNPEIPTPLATICLKCLEVRPKDRYPSALDVTKELRLFLEDKPIQTGSPGLLSQFGRWCRRQLGKAEVRRKGSNDLGKSMQDGFGTTDAEVTSSPLGTRAKEQEPATNVESRLEKVRDDNVQFSTFYPPVVRPRQFYKLLAFAHLDQLRPDAAPDEAEPFEEMINQAKAELKGDFDVYRSSNEPSRASIPREGELVFVLTLEGFRCTQPRQTIIWEKSVEKVVFQIQAPEVRENTTYRGELNVYHGLFLLGSMSLRVLVSKTEEAKSPQQSKAQVYRKIFASYSRKDMTVVEQVEKYVRTLGDRHLRDVVDLRAGEEFNEALKELIREADVFQLFWSHNSMHSPYVRNEWEYALSLKNKPPSFVRPTYWEWPRPQEPPDLPPPELDRLHFEFLGGLNEPERQSPGGLMPTKDPSSNQPERHQGSETIVACPNCNYELHLPSREFLGRRGKCPKCEHIFTMEEKTTSKPEVLKPALKPEVSKPVPSPPVISKHSAPSPSASKPIVKVEVPKPVPQPEKVKPAKPPVKSRGDSIPIPAPGDEDFRNLNDPDFDDEENESALGSDTNDSAVIPDGIWDEIESDAARSTSLWPGSTYRSGVVDVLARCPRCHVGIDFNRDGELQDYTCPRCHARFSLIHPESKPQDLGMPQQVAAFVLQKFPRIGVGPFGNVYRAKDGQTQEPVAIKVSRGGIVSPEEREKFLAKLRLVMQLKYPNIAPVINVGSVDDRIYVVSAYVNGVDLSEYLIGLPYRRLSIREIAMLCGHIASLLHHAHKFGVVHGNLKPSNIRLAANLSPCLFDFSLNDHKNGLQTTGSARIVGTAAYLAPEQLPGYRRDVDAQTDVYALGAILYELLTGQKPFPGEGQELLKQIARGGPMPLRAINPDIPKPLETICLKCLEVNSKNRYQSALDVTKELRLFLEDKPIETPSPALLTQFTRWCKRRSILAGMLLALVILAILGAYFMGWQK